ncbi:MAG TPA: DUF805 domain-containing protein [Stellaceae bacterium]|nr:DUF805 domain-containing protein [Stellaceae bacterium]
MMRGNVIGFDPDTNTGAISGYDGRRYDFVTQDWRSQGAPRHGDVVDFQLGGAERARDIYLIEPEYVRPTFGQFYFSPHGRISRAQYWLRFALPVTVIHVVFAGVTIGFAAAHNTTAAGLFYILWVLYGLAVFWPNLAILIKRSHDRDWPWPFILLLLVPLVQFWPMVELGFLRGTIGGNRFGADPVARR